MRVEESTLPPDSVLDETIAKKIRAEIKQRADQGLYLDAYRVAQDALGPEIRRWPGCRGRVIAARMADCLGGDQLSEVLTFRLGREFPDDPEVMYLTTLQKLARRPLARMWVTMRDQQLPSDDLELQSSWLVLKGILLTGMRDFDRGFDLLHQGRDMCPDDPRPLLRLATAYSASDDIGAAIQTCRDALELTPGYTAAIQTLAHYLSQDNQVDESFELLSETIESTQSGGCRLQLAKMMMQRQEYDQASNLIENIEQWFPLADPLRKGRAKRDSVHSSIANMRSELACRAGDFDKSIELARVVNNPFHDTLIENLNANRESGKRVMLDVPFVLQKHVTCAPATLTMLSGFWGIEVDHDGVVDEICYDGTAPVKQRAWAEENGMVAKEFRVTVKSARDLIDAGIPFGMSSVDPGGGHINVVCGYDSWRGVFLIQDPGLWHSMESLAEKFIEMYQAFGPRGLVLVPKDKQHLLDGIELPDAESFDKQHAIANALLKHNREAAGNVLASMQRAKPDDWLTLWSEIEVARYDVNSPVRLQAIEKLRKQFPENELLTLAACDLLTLLDRQDSVIRRLRECVKAEAPSAESRIRLLRHLESDSDAAERESLLRLVLREAPMNPDGLSLESIRLWDLKERDGALELLRLAAMSGERDEDHAHRYLAAATRMSRQGEVVAVLKERFERHGHASGQPGMTYAHALEVTTHADRAIQVVRDALSRRPDDGDLLCMAASVLGRLDKPSVGIALLDGAKMPLPQDQVLYSKVNLALSDGRPADALAALIEVQRLQPLNPDIVQKIAGLKLDLAGPQEALAYLKGLTEQFPHCRGLLSVTAEYLHQAAKYEEAVEFLDRILATCDYDAWAWRERSLVCAAAGWYDQAYDNAVKALECERSAMSYNILAEALVGQGELEKAAENLRAAINNDCDHVSAILTWMKLCENEAQTRDALAVIFDQLVSQHSNGDGLYAYQRFANGLLGQEELTKQLLKMRQIRPDLFMTHKLLATHYGEYQRFGEAEHVLREAGDRFSHTAEYWQTLGENFISQEKLDEAVESLEKALEICRHDSELAARVAAVYGALERHTDAERTLRNALRASPADPQLMVALARCIENDRERASLVHEAAMVSPASGDNWNLLLSLCQFENRESDAVDAARRLVSERPHDSNAHLRLAEMLHREDQWDQSVDVIRKAIERDSRNVDLHGLLAQRLFERKRLNEAIEACSPSGVDPYDLNQLNLYAANILHQSDRTEEACERLLEALKRDPTNLEGWENLAEWSEGIEKHEWYDQAAATLVERAPHLAASHGYYATTLLRDGKTEAAKKHLRHALELDAQYVYAVQELLRLYIEDNEIDEAKSFVGEIEGVVEAEPVCMGKATVALARRDYKQFVSILEHLPDDVNPIIVTAGSMRSFDLNPSGPIGSALAKSIRNRKASSAIGYAWARVFATPETLEEGINQFAKMPKSEARDTAAVSLLDTLHGICTSEDEAIKQFSMQSIKRILRKLGREIFRIPYAWSSALWTLVSLEQYRKARSLASKYQKVEGRDATMMIPATLAALYRHDLVLAQSLISDAASYQPESMEVRMELVAVMCAVHTLTNRQLDRVISTIDKNELSGSFLRIAHFITIGTHCIKSGDETALIQHWKDEFVAEDDDTDTVDQRIFAELRGRIAESAGDKRLARNLRKSKYVRPS